ncbi:toll/interleukin-1 receptor domain-containing protein [uncultured Tateyamaria sp.]|uniref:toll/interleukin-1 receptor domain-containing protein n=1 Tax=uncultured Tateyamaria sp. TaxID=455651 RepID=UPI00260E28EC|nr:toll/interleukin-1 receptor domain-containing protein [uncultured Tateyamaria sp.]
MFRSILKAVGLGSDKSARRPSEAPLQEQVGSWDVFISHASEDKEEIVRPLASALNAFGLRVWYDEFTLTPGVSLIDTIDDGLARTGLGVIVLSESFLDKRWTEYELNALSERHINCGAPLLTVLHKMGRRQMRRHAPALASLPHFDAQGYSSVQLASLIIEHSRPDMVENIVMRMSQLDAVDHAETKETAAKDVLPAPIRHTELPATLTGQIRLVRALLLGVYTQTYAFWLDGFQRDANPSKNVREWLMMAAVFRETNVYMGILDAEQIEAITKILLGLGTIPIEELQEIEKALPRKDGAMLVATGLQANEPAIDIETRFPVAQDVTEGLRFPNFPCAAEPGAWDRVSIIAAEEDDRKVLVGLRDTLETYDLEVSIVPISEIISEKDLADTISQSHTLVILSPELLLNPVARKHFKAMQGRSGSSHLLLPVWHGIAPDEAEAFSPVLFNLMAYDSTGLDPAKLADKIVAEHLPHKSEGVLRRLLMCHSDFDDEALAYRMPIRQTRFTEQQLARIRAIRAGLFIAFPVSHDFALEAFRRELDVEGELYFWEKTVAVLHELTTYFQIAPSDLTQNLVRYSIALSTQLKRAVKQLEDEAIPEDLLLWLKASLVSSEPKIEVDGPKHILDEKDGMAPDLTDANTGSDVAQLFRSVDKERFPIDLPENLVRELMAT